MLSLLLDFRDDATGFGTERTTKPEILQTKLGTHVPQRECGDPGQRATGGGKGRLGRRHGLLHRKVNKSYRQGQVPTSRTENNGDPGQRAWVVELERKVYRDHAAGFCTERRTPKRKLDTSQARTGTHVPH